MIPLLACCKISVKMLILLCFTNEKKIIKELIKYI